jgi:hypothetical protein
VIFGVLIMGDIMYNILCSVQYIACPWYAACSVVFFVFANYALVLQKQESFKYE